MEYGLVVIWLGLFVGLGALALPASSLVFATLPDRGAGLAIPFAFVVLTVVGYRLGQVTFGTGTAVAAVLVLAVVSALAVRWGVAMRWNRYRDAVLVFALAFLFFVGIRALDPGAHPGGGEKFLDMGLLASLLRAGSLPPDDMWFANEPVQYYYGGHMLAAMFAQLTDTAARYAYNLALAGYYAAFVTAAWGIGAVISAGSGRSYRRGGVVAAFFVGIASNLSTPIRLLVWTLPEGAGETLAAVANIEMKGLATGVDSFHYWHASRVIDAGPRGESTYNLATEFPFFAFLNGDLHAHMMSPIFLLVGVGLAYTYWRTPPEALVRRAVLIFAFIPAAVGVLIVVNTWSAPALVGVTWLTLLFAPGPPWSLFPARLETMIDRATDGRAVRTEGARIVVATVLAVAVALIGAISVASFLSGTTSGRSIGFFSEPTSRLPDLLVVHGAFLAVTVPYLLRRWSRDTVALVGLLGVAAIAITAVLTAPAVGLFVPLLLGAWYRLRTDSGVDFEAVLLVGAMGLLVLVEFVFLVEEAGPGRFNTVFKIYSQVWALWAVAAGAMTAHLPPLRASVERIGREVRRGLPRGRPSGNDDKTSDDAEEKTISTMGSIGAVLLVVLLASTSIYGGFAVASTAGAQSGTPTLDAHQYIEDDHPEEAGAIEWVNDLEGQPTMVSAPGTDIYQWVNAPSSMTGVPTVAGWRHEIGYRGADDYRSRVRDVDAIFETVDPQTRSALLDRYHVEYIYVGPVERDRYDVRAYDEEQGISVAYEDEAVTIYRVNDSELLG
ncbi:Oligosaccharyl transferase, PMT/STT3 family [Halanaeroarchaeum sp. HSR-CO]|uniref:DUF2298 domain-containing protein n=1 Tax=Halanaeroarchaeum sp. HSR-CO TaxID=2866382 RepID=UPI00217E909E|nr:DUF2298 domain-containing protein [Halanaeroarchaeum sp. HSR-CO]UWG47478.1 Oligosaccharyl transferase, PMT/STT3 family [Halanaeroarchaeum sp. HSR-CO]